MCIRDRVNVDVLAQLAGVNVDLDDLGAPGEGVGLEGDAVAEPRADRDDEVGLIDGLVGGVAAVHAQHAEVVRLAIAEDACGHQGIGCLLYTSPAYRRGEHGCQRAP